MELLREKHFENVVKNEKFHLKNAQPNLQTVKTFLAKVSVPNPYFPNVFLRLLCSKVRHSKFPKILLKPTFFAL